MNLSNSLKVVAATLLSLALLGISTSPAWAEGQDKKEEALRLYKIGRLHFDGDDFTKAAAVFKEAFELDPDPILAYNAGRALDRAGDHAEARPWYEKSVALSPEGDIADRCRAALLVLDRRDEAIAEAKRLEAEKRGTLIVHSDVVGEVYANRTLLGTAPGSFRLDPGEYRVEVRRTGSNPFRTKVVIEPNANSDVTAVLDSAAVAEVDTKAWAGFGLMAAGVGTAAVGLNLADDKGLGTGGTVALISAGLIEAAGVGLLIWSAQDE